MKNETYNEILNFTTQDLPHIIGTAAALLLLLVLLVPVLFWLIPELFKLVFAFGIFIARKKKPISLMILGLIVIVLVAVAAFKFKPWEKMNASDTANITNSAPNSADATSNPSAEQTKSTPVLDIINNLDTCITKAENQKSKATMVCSSEITAMVPFKDFSEVKTSSKVATFNSRINATKNN